MDRLPLYVVIISDHNLAELRACLHYRPKRLWMVVTAPMLNQAKRLERVLAAHLPDTRITQLGQEEDAPLNGDFISDVRAWSERHLLPRLRADTDAAKAVLNMTGGTKPLAFMLAQSYPWAELHYQPFLPQASRLERYRLGMQGEIQVMERLELAPGLASPKDIAQLYMDHIRTHSPNPLSRKPASLALAVARLEAQKVLGSDHAIDPGGWNLLTPVLERIWFQTDFPPGEKHFTLDRRQHGLQDERVTRLLEKLAELAPPETLSWDDGSLRLPTPNHKPSSAWRRWISGGWFEQLVEHWLREGGVAPDNLVANIQLKPGESQGREADMLLLHRNILHVLELKADLPVNETLGRFEEQLSSLSGTLGKTAKVLVVGPAVRRRQSDRQWLEFRLRCKDNQVQLIELEEAGSLGGVMPAKPQPAMERQQTG